MIEIKTINNINILEIEKEENPFILLVRDAKCTNIATKCQLQFESRIICQEYICDYITEKYNYKDKQLSFEKKVTFDLRHHFNGTDDLEFKVLSMKESALLNPTHPKWYQDARIWIGCASFIILLCFCVIIFGCYSQRQLKLEQKRRKEHEQKIYNPLFLAIGIEFYHHRVENPGFTDGIVNDLNGVDRDYQNIQELCKKMGYKIFPERLKLEWTQKEILLFLREKAGYFSKHKKTDDNPNGFDSLFVICSGHGYKNSIITSDYQLIRKTAIHRLFSTNYAEIRNYPRVFMYDCCDGNQDRSHYPADYDDDDDDEQEEEKEGKEGDDDDHGKNFQIEDIDDMKESDHGKNFMEDQITIRQFDKEIWKRDQKNPDYKLSLIHGANEGFQAKMNSIDGSYLIYEFAKRMIKNIDNGDKKLYFGEIIDGIQHHLHDEGKQQITATFNNNTRYLKFIKRGIGDNNNIGLLDQDEKLQNELETIKQTVIDVEESKEKETKEQEYGEKGIKSKYKTKTKATVISDIDQSALVEMETLLSLS